MKYSARPNVSVSYIANGDARTAGRLCHCYVTKRRLYTRADFPRRIRRSAIQLNIIDEMSNESVAADPPVYATSVLYHCDEVDYLFASLFAIWLMEVGRTVSTHFTCL